MNQDSMKYRNYIAGVLLLSVIGISVLILNADEIFRDDGSIYYCSNDSEEYAESMGGILCPEGPGVVPMCPNDEPCKCIAIDNSCTDGDDDWGYYPDKPSEDEKKEEEK